MKALLFLILVFIQQSSFAGNQKYEKLKLETQQMLSTLVSDFSPISNSFIDENEAINWLFKEQKLSKYIPNYNDRIDFLKTVHYEATRAGIEPIWVLGVVHVESKFKKYAVSSVGARGYMQVMPFWIDIIGEKEHNLFHIRTNLRYGTVILKHYLEIEKGNLPKALSRYNGSIGKDKYPNLVLNAIKYYEK